MLGGGEKLGHGMGPVKMLDLTESNGSWNAEEGIGKQDISELESSEFDGRSDMGLKTEEHSRMRLT